MTAARRPRRRRQTGLALVPRTAAPTPASQWRGGHQISFIATERHRCPGNDESFYNTRMSEVSHNPCCGGIPALGKHVRGWVIAARGNSSRQRISIVRRCFLQKGFQKGFCHSSREELSPSCARRQGRLAPLWVTTSLARGSGCKGSATQTHFLGCSWLEETACPDLPSYIAVRPPSSHL